MRSGHAGYKECDRNQSQWKIDRKLTRNIKRKPAREGIHPDYYRSTVTCNVGNTLVTVSLQKPIHAESIHWRHPAHTGQQKITRLVVYRTVHLSYGVAAVRIEQAAVKSAEVIALNLFLSQVAYETPGAFAGRHARGRCHDENEDSNAWLPCSPQRITPLIWEKRH